MIRPLRGPAALAVAGAWILCLWLGGFAYAQQPMHPHWIVPGHVRTVPYQAVPVQYQAVQVPPPRLLGTFYETPYMTVGGNGFPGGAGYAPLQQYGDSVMSLYGPFASLRATAAPVQLYTRSACGQVQPELATSFSYPFLPQLSPVKYPVRTQIRGEARSLIRYSPADAGFNWVDQN
jgi:hypothetical protein